MDPKWAPALVTAAIAVAGWLITYGSTTNRLANVEKAAADIDTDLQQHKAKVWERVNTVENKVSKIEGRMSPKGRGANA